MDTQSLAAIGVLTILLAAGAGFVLADGSTTHTAENATVRVSADASVERTPDKAIVTVAAVGRGDTAAAARNNLTTSAVEQALENESANVTASQFTISPEYEYSESGRRQVGYIAVQTIEAETTDVGSAGSLIDAAVDSGADRVEGVTYDLQDQTKTAARETALQEAMASARSDAQTLAAAENRTVGSALTVETSASSRFTVRTENAASRDSQTTISPGPVTVDTTVEVTYELD